MGHGGKKDSDMRHDYFLNSTCDIGENKRQRHATETFLKIDMRHREPPVVVLGFRPDVNVRKT